MPRRNVRKNTRRKGRSRSRRPGTGLGRLVLVECPGCLLCVSDERVHLLGGFADDDDDRQKWESPGPVSPRLSTSHPMQPGANNAERT